MPSLGCWAAMMYVCVALPLRFPVTLSGVNSWRGQKSPLTLLSLSLSPVLSVFPSASTHRVLFLRPALSFFFSRSSRRAPLQLSFTLVPSSTLSVLKSYISDSLGTTSTCFSADVCINQTEGPVVLDDLSSHTHTHSHFFIPTSELVDSSLLRHAGEGNDALRKVTLRLIHFYESMRTHAATGIVSYVDSITSCALGGETNILFIQLFVICAVISPPFLINIISYSQLPQKS